MFVDEYFANRVARGEIQPESVAPMRRIVLQWVRFADGEWTDDRAAEWVHDPTLRPNSRKNRLSRLRPYIRWLVTHGHFDRDITLAVPAVNVQRGNPRDLPAASIGALLSACPDLRARTIVMLMAHCGLRCVDVSRIRVEDIDVHRRNLDVRAKGGQGEVTHTVPIPAEAWTTVTAYLAEAGHRSGPLIRSQGNEPCSGVSNQHVSILVRRWIKTAGLKAFPHDGVGAHSLRHSCAQHLIDGGAEIRQVQHILGHRQVTTTELYLRHEPPGLRDAIEGRHYIIEAA